MALMYDEADEKKTLSENTLYFIKVRNLTWINRI